MATLAAARHTPFTQGGHLCYLNTAGKRHIFIHQHTSLQQPLFVEMSQLEKIVASSFGLERAPDGETIMPEMTTRYARALGRHFEEKRVDF